MSQAFDVVFAGGGTTACVVAGRLTAMDPSLRILIIESGQHSRDVPHHVQPARYPEHLAPGTTTTSQYISKPSAHLNGRSLTVPSGRSVGGGSAVNFMLYVRGAASDYDDWVGFGNKGWSFHELLPLIRNLETFYPVPDRPDVHGYSGPIQVSAGGVHFDVTKQFLDVGRAYDPARPHVDDNNDFVTPNAYSPAYHYIDPVTGTRSDAASRYLYPHTDNPNLTILVGKRVKRVIVENGRAVGVEYGTDRKEINDELTTVKASKLVVISAGAFGSPAILERSGIGARTVLEKHGISVQVDLPGVGENYQDHPLAYQLFYASDDTETMDDVWSNPEAIDHQMEAWKEDGSGKIAHTGLSAILRLRLTDTQLTSAGSALQQRWETFFKHNPDKPMSIIVPFAGYPRRGLTSLDRKVLCAVYYVFYPYSLGSVHITSGSDLNSPLEFDTGFLTQECDIEQLALQLKFARELFRRMPAYRGEVADFSPKFPVGSPAACKETDVPVAIDAPDIVYSDADDEAITKFIRDSTLPGLHSLGTCAMKPRSQGGVVDERLNVYGVSGLKVADLSICPSNVSNNTCSTALLIGEKAAAIIAEDLGHETT